MKRYWKRNRFRRFLALFVAVCTFMTGVPLTALAQEDPGTGGTCPNHVRHDESCGYVEGDETKPCLHVCESCATEERLLELDSTLDEQIKELASQYFGDSPAELTPEYQEALMKLYSSVQKNGTMTASLPGSDAAGEGTVEVEALEEGVEFDPEVKIIAPEDILSTDDGGIQLTFRLSKAADYPVSFRVRTLGASAKSGESFIPVGHFMGQIVEFPKGSVEQSINMAIRDDSARIEGTELFLIMCDQPQNAVFEGENPYSAFAWGKILKDNGYNEGLLTEGKNALDKAVSTGIKDAPLFPNQDLADYTYMTWDPSEFPSLPIKFEKLQVMRFRTEDGAKASPDERSMASGVFHLSEDAKDLVRDGIANKFRFWPVIVYDRSGGDDGYWVWTSDLELKLYNKTEENIIDWQVFQDTSSEEIKDGWGPDKGYTYTDLKEWTDDASEDQRDVYDVKTERVFDITPDYTDLALYVMACGTVNDAWLGLQTKYYQSEGMLGAWLQDTKQPEVVGVTVPKENFSSGDCIPITVEFSEPIVARGLTLSVQDRAGGLRHLEEGEPYYKGKYVSFPYVVEDRNNTNIVVTGLSADRDAETGESLVTDLAGNTFEGWTPENGTLTLEDAVIETPRKELAFTDNGMKVVYPEKPDGGNWESYIRSDRVRVEIPLNYSEDPGADLTNWIASSYQDGAALPTVKISTDSGHTLYDVAYALDENGDPVSSTLVSEFDAADLQEGNNQISLWIADEADGPFRPVLAAGLPDAVLGQADVTDIELTAAYGSAGTAVEEDGNVLLSQLVDTDDNISPIQFTAALTPDRVNYPEVEWSVENADQDVKEPIAQITRDPNDPLKAQLTLTGSAFGEVTVTATANNGGEGEDNEKAVSQSFSFTVERDISLFSGVTTTVKVGEAGSVKWLNSDGDIYNEAVYTVKLYRADKEGNPEGEQIGDDYFSEKGANSVEIGEGVFSEISQFTDGAYRPAYVAVITTDDLYNLGEKLEARSLVTVYPKPVNISLEPEEEDINGGLYLLDDAGSFRFRGTVENWLERDDGNSEVTVTRNDEPYGEFTCTVDDQVSGSVEIPAVAEGNLKDIYIITVKAKNNNAGVYSSDSLVLQVYDRDALEVIVENENGEVIDTMSGDGGSLTVSNTGQAALDGGKLDISQADMDAILGLKRQIDLKRYLYVNYEGIGWNTVSDRMAWNSENTAAATINYRNGTLFEDIRNFDYTNYRPDETMMLVGHEDGESRITVTHGRTGNQVGFDVTVDTLKDQLYLFQVYPMAATAITYSAYTDESRTQTEERVVSTNENGEFAVYEEFGIASDVRFERTDADGSTWLGTIFHQNLLTQENDGSKMELYPLNSIDLREVTVQNFYLKDEAGNPYSGPVRYSYGVYKNGEFCPQARLSDDKGSAEHARDKAEVISDESGMVRLDLDSTQFITVSELAEGATEADLGPGDEITYIVEFEFGENYTQYQPQVVEIDASVNDEQAIRSADSILNLRSAAEANKAFVDSYQVQYKDEMKASYDATDNTGYVGLSNEFQDVDLKSRVIWWNTLAEDLPKGSLYETELTDDTDQALKGQKSSTVVYPFGNFPVSTNILRITPELFGGLGIRDEGYEPITGKIRLYDETGELYAVYSVPFKLANLIGTEDISDFSQGLYVGSATGELPISMFEADAAANEASRESNGGGFSGEAFETGGFDGGDMANGALNGLAIGCPSFLPVKYNIVATDDPNEWQFIGVIEFAFGNDPDVDVSSQSTTKMQNNFSSAKKTIEEFADRFSKDDSTPQQPPQQQSSQQQSGSNWKGNVNATAMVRGFVQGTMKYNPSTERWNAEFDGGGLAISGSAGYVWNGNSMVGPVPFTYSIGAGADLEVALEFSPMSEEAEEGGQSIYTDFLSTVKFVAWAKAFAGIGFDWTIIAAKLGVFGNLAAGINVKTLNQAYRAEDKNTSYNYFNVGGEIGLKVELRMIIFEYEKVLVSGKLGYHRMDKIDGREEYTETNMPDKIYDSYEDDGAELYEREEKFRAMSPLNMANMRVASASLKAESRSYLQNPTVWSDGGGIQLFSLDADNAFAQIGSNVYPGAEPVIARDGSLVVFRTDNGSTDLNENGIGWAVRSGDTYMKQDGLISGTIENEAGEQVAAAASNLDFDGTSGFGVAVWEQQNEASMMAADAPVDYNNVNDMMNRTEIVLSVVQDGSWSEPLRLTDNSTPDMAPQAAVSSNGKAIVVWRQPAAADEGNPMTFDASDEIVYSYYDGSSWSEVRQLDLGDLGAVKGLDAAIADDGTALVTTAVQTAGPSNAMSVESGINPETNGSNEITYTLIGADGEIKKDRVRLTDDGAADENPQAAYADGKFLLAWYSTEESEVQNPVSGELQTKEVSDIKLRAVNTDGTIEGGFVNSISEINKTSPMEVGAEFTLAQGAGGSLNDLALIWKTSEKSGDEDSGELVYDKDVVHAVKFLDSGDGRVRVTAPMELADMGPSTTADSVSAYVNGNTIKAVILKSEPTSETETYSPDASGAGADAENSPVTLPVTMSSMVSATVECTDSIAVSDIAFDPEEIRAGAVMPVQFNVQNTGLTPITSITAQIGDRTVTLNDLNVLPNEVQAVYAEHLVGSRAEDADYTVTASFAGGNTASASGTLELAMSDVSIGSVKVLEESEGTRTMSVSLYNDSALPLADSGLGVALNFYESQASDAEAVPELSCVITDPEQLQLIDEKGFSKQVTYTIPEDRLEDGEIPENGMKLFVRADVIDPESGERAVEKDYTYNETSVQFDSLFKDGVQFKTDAVLDNSGDVSQSVVTVKNLSLKPAEKPGNVLVSLLDEGGSVLETVSLASGAGELFRLGDEAEDTRTVSFTQKGTAVTARYLPVADGADYENSLMSLEAAGRSFAEEELTPEGDSEVLLTADSVNLSGTLLTAAAKSPKAEIAVYDADGVKLAEGTGHLSFQLPLVLGGNGETVDNKVTVTVDPADENAAAMAYQLTVRNTRDSSGSVVLESSAQTATGWTNAEKVTLTQTAEELENFAPEAWQYTVNGGNWTDAEDEEGQDSRILTTLREEGEYAVQGRIVDGSGYSMTSGTVAVKIDRTEPEIREESLIFLETEEELLPEEDGVIGLLKNALNLDGDGNTDRQLKVRVDLSDDRSGIYRAVIRAGEREYVMTRAGDTDTYEGVVEHAFRGGLEVEVTDLAGNTASYTTKDLVIEAVQEPEPGETELEIGAGSVGIRSGFTGTDIEEFGVQYRKAGESAWTDAEPQEGSKADSFTFRIEGLEPNTAYEYRLGYRLITQNAMIWLEEESFTTQVEIAVPVKGAGSCEGDTVSADKTGAWPGEEVEFTITSCEDHTVSGLTVNGTEHAMENTESRTHTFRYVVTGDDRVVTSEAAFAEKQISRVTEIPEVGMNANDENNQTAESLKAYLDSRNDLTVVYDNGTVKEDYAAEWTLAEGQEWSPKGGGYIYSAAVPLRGGETSVSRSVTVEPVQAWIAAPENIVKTISDDGWLLSELGLPETVEVSYSAEAEEADLTCPVSWTGWADSEDGRAEGDIVLTGTVSLPAWAGGTDQTSLTVIVTDKTVVRLTDLTVEDKSYDGTTDAAFTADGEIGLEAVEGSYHHPFGVEGHTVTGEPVIHFLDKNAGTDKGVTVEGLQIEGEYAEYFRLDYSNLRADITPREITVTGLEAVDRAYDFTAKVELTGGTAEGILPEEAEAVQILIPTEGEMEDADAGKDKAVTAEVVFADTVSDADRANYTIVQPELTVDITPLKLGTPAGLGWEKAGGTRIFWNPVEHASGYRVQFYCDGEKLGEPVPVEGTAFDCLELAERDGRYSFAVQAVGEGNFADGDYSSMSPQNVLEGSSFASKTGDFPDPGMGLLWTALLGAAAVTVAAVIAGKEKKMRRKHRRRR